METYNFASSITPWDWVSAFDNVDDMVECFEYLMLGLFDHFVPERTRTFRAPPTPWITDSIRGVMIDRDRACL